MLELTLAQLEQQYATNEYRQALLANLKEEISGWEIYLATFRVGLFGSYLTEKSQPSDIDVLLAGLLKPNSTFPHKLPRIDEAKVHVISIIGLRVLSTKDQLVKKFNEEVSNLERGISLSTEQVTDLVL